MPENNPIKLRGEDVAEALRDWVKADLKEGPRQAYDLGKFFFTVSVGTIGAITAIERLNQTSKIDVWMTISLVLLFLSILVAINLARPRKYKMGGETDLMVEYEKQVNRVIGHLWTWLALWLAGTLLGGYAVRV